MGNLTRDSYLDNITLYWLTGTGASSARWYWEFGRFLAAAEAAGQQPPPVAVPVGFTNFPGEIWAAPRSWVETVYPANPVLQQVDRRRPLRGLGGARALRYGGARRVQLTALTQPSTSLHTPRHGVVRPGARGLARKLVLGSPGPQLEAAGHRVTTVDLPAEDPDATFETYAQAVADAIPDDDTTVVGHSLSGLTIPLVAAHRRVRGLVYLCGLVPIPGL